MRTLVLLSLTWLGLSLGESGEILEERAGAATQKATDFFEEAMLLRGLKNFAAMNNGRVDVAWLVARCLQQPRDYIAVDYDKETAELYKRISPELKASCELEKKDRLIRLNERSGDVLTMLDKIYGGSNTADKAFVDLVIKKGFIGGFGSVKPTLGDLALAVRQMGCNADRPSSPKGEVNMPQVDSAPPIVKSPQPPSQSPQVQLNPKQQQCETEQIPEEITPYSNKPVLTSTIVTTKQPTAQSQPPTVLQAPVRSTLCIKLLLPNQQNHTTKR